MINVEKFRSRSTKDEPIELQSPVTKDELVAEVWIYYSCLFCEDDFMFVWSRNPLYQSIAFIYF